MRNRKEFHSPFVISAHRRGAIAPLAAVLMVVLLAFVVLALDVGYICLARGQLQNAADAAALAAAAKLKDATGNPAHRARKAAKDYASLNLAAGDAVELTNEDIKLGVWDDQNASFFPLASGAEDLANAVQVTCSRTSNRGNPLPLCFGGILGRSLSDVAATATARVRTSRCGLIVGLTVVTMSGGSHTDSFNAENGTYQPATASSNGHVCSNGHIVMSGSATIHGDAHPGPGKDVRGSGSGVTGDIKSLGVPMQFDSVDPGNAVTNNDNGSIPVSDRGNVPVNASGEFSLAGGDGVSLSPGTYYFTKMDLTGGSTVRINGPTIIYVENNCTLSGGSLANYTAVPKNLQLYPMGSRCVISGSSEFCGVIYGPTTRVERSGSSDFFGSIVAGTLVMSGSGGIHADDSLDLSILSQGPARSVLVE